MRRIALCAALFLVVGVAAPAYATTTFNTSGSQLEVSASWFFEEGGSFAHGNVWAAQVKGGGSHLEFFEGTSTPIVCEDGSEGVHHEFVFGSGPVTVVVDKQYRTGSATAVVDLFVDSFDECFGPLASPSNGGGGTVIPDVPISVDAVGTSNIAMSRSSNGFHIPGEVNEHSRFDARQRFGHADVTWGDNERFAESAAIGKISWRSHSNS